MADLNRFSVNDQTCVADLDFPGEDAVGRVKPGEIGHRLKVGRFIDGDDLNVLFERRFVQGAQEATADAAIAIDRQSYGCVHVDSVVD